jgi:hypothetical protein
VRLRKAVLEDPDKGYWRTYLDRQQRESPIEFYRIARLYAHLGEKDHAYEYLKKAAEKWDRDLEAMLYDPVWDRSDMHVVEAGRHVGLLR